MIREYAYDIMPEIQKRYATKNFSSRPVSREALLPLVEAARYAPSCYNEQPWRYLLGDDPKTHEKLARCLVPGNAWAKGRARADPGPLRPRLPTERQGKPIRPL